MRSGETIYPGDTIHVPAEDYAKLLDDRDRYKAALEKIAAWGCPSVEEYNEQWSMNVARAALAAKDHSE